MEWLACVDRNSKFIYQKAFERKRENKITGLYDIFGVQIRVIFYILLHVISSCYSPPPHLFLQTWILFSLVLGQK